MALYQVASHEMLHHKGLPRICVYMVTFAFMLVSMYWSVCVPPDDVDHDVVMYVS